MRGAFDIQSEYLTGDDKVALFERKTTNKSFMIETDNLKKKLFQNIETNSLRSLDEWLNGVVSCWQAI